MSKRTVTALYAVAAIVLVAIIFGFSKLNAYLQTNIKDRLDSYINSSNDGLYTYKYESIDIEVLRKKVHIRGVMIEPKQSSLDSIEQNKLKALMSVAVGEVVLNDIYLYPLLVNNKIEVKRIGISDAHLAYLFDKQVKPKPSTFMISNLFSKRLKGALIHDFEIKNASMSMSDSNIPDSTYLKIDSIDVAIHNILADEYTVQNKQPFEYGSFEIHARRFNGNFIDHYNLSSGALSINSKDSTFRITDLSLIPSSIPKSDLEKQFTRTIFQISVKELLMSSINIAQWDTLGSLEINKISIAEPSLKVSVDKKWPKPMHEKPLPSASIRNIPIPLTIDTLNIKSGNVLFHQITNDDKPSFTLKFGQINAMGTNVSNDSLVLSKKPNFTFSANTLFLDSAKLDLRLIFNILSPDEAYHAKVNMDPMPFSVINPILDGQANVQIDGTLNALEVNFDANKYSANGTADMDYSDLKLKLHKTKVTDEGTKEKNAWLLNTLVNPILRTNNNRENTNFKSGVVDYERPLDISFFGMLWHSTKTGLMSTLMPNQGQKKEKSESDKKEKEEVKKSHKKHKGNQPG